jgi:putative ABC transport system substrate-binding protein
MRRVTSIVGLVLILAGWLDGVTTNASAQEPGRMYRLGILFRTQQALGLIREVTLPELARQGFVEGRNLTLIVLDDQTASAIAEMAAARPDVVITADFDTARLLASGSPVISVVMSFISDDPVARGLVGSLRRPGGRITGQTILADELEAKRLTLLFETFPHLRRVAVLAPDPPRSPLAEAALRETADRLGVTLSFVRAATPRDFPAAITRAREAAAEALLITTFAQFSSNTATLAALAIEAHLPTVCQWASMARDGCLLGYGPSQRAIRLRTADFVARIFRGSNPGEMPIEQPTVFEFAINLRTARVLGITVPPALLARADEVIE